MAFSPWMGSVTLTTANTVYQLSALLSAIEKNLSTRLSYLRVEFDLGGTGNVYVGGASVASNNCGSHLVPTQQANFDVFDSGLVLTSDVYLKADTNSQQVNVTAIPAGA